MLKLTKRAGIYYLRGSVSVGNDSRGVYESTRIRIRDPGARQRAQAFLEKRRAEILSQIQDGPQAKVTFAVAANRYILRRRPKLIEDNPRFDPTAPDAVALQAQEIVDHLESLNRASVTLKSLTRDDINSFFRDRHLARGNSLSTARRHASVYIAIMNMAVKEGWTDSGFPRPDLGDYDRHTKPIVGKYFEADEIAWMIENAPEHFRPIVALGFATGRRTGDLAWLSRPGRYDETVHSGELRMTQGEEHIFLGRTKNGKAKTTYLPQWLLPILHAHLARRADSFDELFLTDKGLPYKRPKVQGGGVFKRAFGTLIYRLTLHLLLEARRHPVNSPERAHFVRRSQVVRQATPHWFRHNAASHIYRNGGGDADAMDHLGWDDHRMAARYRHMSPERGRALANSLDFGIGTETEKRAKSVQSLKRA